MKTSTPKAPPRHLSATFAIHFRSTVPHPAPKMSKAKARKAARSTKATSKHTSKPKPPPTSKNLKRKLLPTATGPTPKQAKASKPSPQIVTPTIPFNPHDRVLLVGEGDFSYAASLTTTYHCTSLTATSFDSSPALLSKYPHCAAHLASVIAVPTSSVYHDIDATALSKTLPRSARTHKYDRVIFNFPHTGGLSTDVNRQVRYNQELLVKFLQSAKKLLSTAPPPRRPRNHSLDEDEDEDTYPEDPEEHAEVEETPTSKLAKESSTILVTLFDAEPYTLWNIKDLARHVGLKSITSFAFPWEAYPGYRHARTVGTIEGKGGAWKGEERAARTYVFGLKEEVVEDGSGAFTGANAVGVKRKRRRGRESESESGDEG
ncbi:hypothetical protein BU16DRAFT_223149 [Lophium mytilinum]|uniref:25S rRNA (uridine-N(3))-methyltransferase BMT5-like domain-containing protein n=1 Tax=Lophium mytilinum TaxID=390894 RepID=A0A6A6Q997_9PEZI|nr:hypothetical protein BU16DRAFT_223149 [Lophium mytilinum]